MRTKHRHTEDLQSQRTRKRSSGESVRTRKRDEEEPFRTRVPGTFSKAAIASIHVGAVIAKKNGNRILVVVKDTTPFWSNHRRFLLADRDTRELSKHDWDAHALLVHGYRRKRDIPFERVQSYLPIERDGARKRRRRMVKEMRQSTRQHLCNNGQRIPIQKCTIVKGHSIVDNPKKTMLRDGKTVFGVRVECPICKRRVKVIYQKLGKSLWTARHKRPGVTERRTKTR